MNVKTKTNAIIQLQCNWWRHSLLSMTETVPTPLQLGTFWASIQNKQGLGPQLVAREHMKE